MSPRMALDCSTALGFLVLLSIAKERDFSGLHLGVLKIKCRLLKKMGGGGAGGLRKW